MGSVPVNSFKWGGGGGHVDHLRGHQDHVLIFLIIFNLTLICHLSGQEALFDRSLTRDPSLI